MQLKYTVQLINETTNEVVESAPAKTKQNARGWSTRAKREHGKGFKIEIKKN